MSTDPIRNLDDLKKLKIRMLSGPAKVMNKIGGSGVYIPYEEVYLAMSQGTIDGGLFGGAKSYSDLEFPDIADYYCKTPWVSPVTTSYIFNLESWNSLPEHLQQIIESEVYRQCMFNRNYCMSGETEAGGDYTVTELGAEDVATLTEAAIEVWEEEAAKGDRCAEAVEMIKELNRQAGRIK